jgi:hypothetical protein
MKVEVKVNHTNPGKKEAYGVKLGHSKGNDNSDANPFEGKDARVAPHETTGPNVGSTASSQVVSMPGASPNRARFSEPKLIKENGSTHFAHVTNIPKKEKDERAAADADKVKLFSRPSSGNNENVPRPGMSNRDFSSTGAKGPNQEKA